MKESSIERTVCDCAKRHGWVPLKLNGPGDAGKPDRVFFGKDGQVVLIEFKATGEKPRKLQLHWAEKLRRMGHKVYFIDNVEVGCAIFT